jgi:hypothetical protein
VGRKRTVTEETQRKMFPLRMKTIMFNERSDNMAEESREKETKRCDRKYKKNRSKYINKYKMKTDRWN